MEEQSTQPGPAPNLGLVDKVGTPQQRPTALLGMRGSHSGGQESQGPQRPHCPRLCALLLHQRTGGGQLCGSGSESFLCRLSSSVEIGYSWSGAVGYVYFCLVAQKGVKRWHKKLFFLYSSVMLNATFFCYTCCQSLCAFNFVSFLNLKRVCC